VIPASAFGGKLDFCRGFRRGESGGVMLAEMEVVCVGSGARGTVFHPLPADAMIWRATMPALFRAHGAGPG